MKPDELPLFARTSDPETSHAAAEAYDRTRLGSAMALAVELHRAPGGLADYEYRALFAARFPGPCCDHLYQQARSSARDKGLIRDSGRRARNPITQRLQVVWEACDAPPPAIEKCAACGHVLRRREARAAAC
jgi:hypothetical protein